MKIDLHVHSSGISLCGHIVPEEVVRLYKEASYDAIVLCNHYSRGIADHHIAKTGKDFFDLYHAEYEIARKAGEKYGLKVFCGYELRFDGSDNDYLVYGLPEDLAKKYYDLTAMTPKTFSALAKERDFLFYQAHPFRNSMKIIPPDYLFGIEVRNGHPRHDSRNDVAALWAEKYNLHGIAGSDCHQIEDVGISGIVTKENVDTLQDLIQVLKNDRYSII